MNTLNYTLKDQCLPSTWQMLMRHLPSKRNISNIQLNSIKTLNPLGAMKVTPRKLKTKQKWKTKLKTKLDFKISYEKQQGKNYQQIPSSSCLVADDRPHIVLNPKLQKHHICDWIFLPVTGSMRSRSWALQFGSQSAWDGERMVQATQKC